MVNISHIAFSFTNLFGDDVNLQLTAVVLMEALVDALVSIPISYYGTMVIEEKYGFNRSTVKTFAKDQIRHLLLGICLSILLAWGLSVLHLTWDIWMIPLFAISVFSFTLHISFLYPIFSRIGNKFVPLEDGELKDNLIACDHHDCGDHH